MKKRHAISAVVAALTTPALAASPSMAGTSPTSLPPPEGPPPETVAAVDLAGGQRLAPKLSEVATPSADLVPQDIAALRADAVAHLNEMAAEDYGPFDAAKAARIGRSDYYGDRDIELYVVREADGTSSIVAAPLHVDVLADGSLLAKDAPAANGVGAPVFGGPWGNQLTDHYFKDWSNDGGYQCTTSTVRNSVRYSRAPLSDTNPSKTYWGVSVSGVVEITKYSHAEDIPTMQCEDWLDYARVEYRNETAGAIYVSQDPRVDFNSSCKDTTISVGGGFGGASASVSQTVQQCEEWDVYGGNAGPAATKYGIEYDNNDACEPQSRELAEVAVVEMPQGSTSMGRLVFGARAGNGPKVGGFCSFSCPGS